MLFEIQIFVWPSIRPCINNEILGVFWNKCSYYRHFEIKFCFQIYFPNKEEVKKSGKLYLWIALNICVLTCSPPGSQSAAITTPLCPERARSGVLRTENSSLSSVSVPMWREYVKVSISYQFRVISLFSFQHSRILTCRIFTYTLSILTPNYSGIKT